MPYVQSRLPTIGRTLADALLAALMARPGAALLTTPTAHLYTAGPQLGPDVVPGDFTEATFAGYADITITAMLGPINSGEDVVALHVQVDFVGGAVVPPGETIMGYWIDNGSTTLYLAEEFQTPIPIAQVGDFLSIDVQFGQPTLLDLQG
jgi:hypothetical protein